MPARAVSGDLSVFSVASASQLAALADASIMFDNEDADGAPLNRVYESAQVVGRSGRVRASLMSIVSGSTKVAGIDVSAFSFGGTDYLGGIENGSLNIEWQHEEGKAAGDLWAYPVCVGKRLSLEGDLLVPATGGAGLSTVAVGTVSGLEIDASVTISGNTTTFAGLLKSFEHTFPRRGIQRHRVAINGRSPDTGDFPAAPSGTTGLLAYFLNSLAVQAFSITSKASGGVTYGGNMLPLSYRLRWARNEIVMAECEWATQGTVTASATA